MGPRVGLGLGDPRCLLCPDPFCELLGAQSGPERGDLLASPRRDQQDLGAVLLQATAGLPPWGIRIKIGRGAPGLLMYGAQEERPVVSAAPRRLVMESFPLLSPRTSE